MRECALWVAAGAGSDCGGGDVPNERVHHPGHAGAGEQHDQHKTEAVEETGKRDVDLRGPVRHEDDEGGADDRAGYAGDATDDRADQDLDGLGRLERGRIDEAVDHGEQAAGQAGECRGDRESGESHSRRVDAERLRHQEIIAQRAQAAAGSRRAAPAA